MKHMLVALAIAVAVLSFPDAGQAATIFFASLTNSQENPPVVPTLDGVVTPRPASFGSASFLLNDAMTELTLSVTVFNSISGGFPHKERPWSTRPTSIPARKPPTF